MKFPTFSLTNRLLEEYILVAKTNYMNRKPKVLNVPRKFVSSNQANGHRDIVWISIFEPVNCDQDALLAISPLKCFPRLFVSFWDVIKPIPAIGGEMDAIQPPSHSDAKKIVDFLLEHKGKDVIVNCTAGISRSGAVAQFCEDQLGYDWRYEGKRKAHPNSLLYKLMVDYFSSLEHQSIIKNEKNH